VPSDARALTGLVGERDLAQPLLTMRTAEGRVELSGATAANWAAKTANLLTDGYGAPERVGVVAPLHWQTVCVLLGAARTGATVVVGRGADDVAGCAVVLARADVAAACADTGADVLVLSDHPLAAPVADLPPGTEDFAREVPTYDDLWSAPAVRPVVVVAGGTPAEPAAVDAGPGDRVLLTADPRDVDGLALLLGLLRAGAALVLVPDAVDLAAVVREEAVTATAGVDVEGVRRVG
jgi:uncharacterized protein (TIGR03089 family)